MDKANRKCSYDVMQSWHRKSAFLVYKINSDEKLSKTSPVACSSVRSSTCTSKVRCFAEMDKCHPLSTRVSVFHEKC